jgi:hypothetical protein
MILCSGGFAVTGRAHLISAVLTFAAVLPQTSARADDAYVCDGGRLVYARPETLEKLKATDPCIAGYYAAVQQPPSVDAAIPAPIPGTAVLPPVASKSRPKDKPQVVQPRSAPATRDASLKPAIPETATGTDYRNVRVINAPDGGTVYRHDR